MMIINTNYVVQEPEAGSGPETVRVHCSDHGRKMRKMAGGDFISGNSNHQVSALAGLADSCYEKYGQVVSPSLHLLSRTLKHTSKYPQQKLTSQ